MAPGKQATLGQFFGKVGQPVPTLQTKLSFATRSGPDEANKTDRKKRASSKDVSEEDKSEDEMKEPAAKRRKARRVVEDESSEEGSKSPKSPKSPKAKSPSKSPKVKSEAESETEPKTESPKSPKSPKAKSPKVKSEAEPPKSPKKRGRPKKEAASEITETGEEKELAREEAEDEDTSGSESEKPRVAAKVRKTVQQALSEIKGDAYPDWPAGEAVPYAALCRTFSLIELTSSRLVMMEYCSLFLRQVLRLTPGDLLPTVLLMVNKLAPDYAGVELGIGESLIMKAIGEATGRSLAVIKQDQKEIGDLGLVAVKSRATQPTMFQPRPLTVPGVHRGLMAIATEAGAGTQQRKVDGIKKLLSAADAAGAGGHHAVDITKDRGGPSEAKFLVRFLEGKLRLGLAEKTVLVSLAQAVVHHEAQAAGRARASDAETAAAEAVLKTVYSELPSWDQIVPAMLAHGIEGLRAACKLRPGIPLKPMLAKPTKSITEVLDRFENQTFTCEFKYDGERAQIHYVAADPEAGEPGLAAIFSRNSEELSNKYPDILARLPAWVRPTTRSFVLDCETVAWDVAARTVLPFQQLMTRKRKDVKIADVKVKVCVFAFDLLYLNGEAVVELPLRRRRELLQTAFSPVEGEMAFATHMDGQELDAIQAFLDESVRSSCEGLMVKMLDGPESGYEPSKRSRNWLKIKKDYLAGIGDSLDLVVLGAYYGRGKRTAVYGSFLLACYNPSADIYESICNIGTGFSEAVLDDLYAQLSQTVIDRPKPFYAHSTGNQHQPDVWFEPRFVWEVRTADLTLSPRYKAGFREGVDTSAAGADGDSRGISLRFPRFIRIRDDKKPAEATTSRQVAEMFHRQESIAKTKGPSVDDDFEY